MYTFELLGLISADLIRLRENPVDPLLPLLGRVFLCSRWTKSLVGLGGLRRGLLPWVPYREILGHR